MEEGDGEAAARGMEGGRKKDKRKRGRHVFVHGMSNRATLQPLNQIQKRIMKMGIEEVEAMGSDGDKGMSRRSRR